MRIQESIFLNGFQNRLGAGERKSDAGSLRLGGVEALRGVLSAKRCEIAQDGAGSQDVWHPERDGPNLMSPTGTRGKRCVAVFPGALAMTRNLRNLKGGLKGLSLSGLQGLQLDAFGLVRHVIHLHVVYQALPARLSKQWGFISLSFLDFGFGNEMLQP